MRILSIEDELLLDLERDIVSWFVGHDVAGLLPAYYLRRRPLRRHAVVLVWLYRRRAAHYPRARLVLSAARWSPWPATCCCRPRRRVLIGYTDLMASTPAAAGGARTRRLLRAWAG